MAFLAATGSCADNVVAGSANASYCAVMGDDAAWIAILVVPPAIVLAGSALLPRVLGIVLVAAALAADAAVIGAGVGFR